MSTARRELVLKSGVLAFDGDVVEAFGFTSGTSQRIPVSQLKAIDERKGTLTISCHGSNLMPLVIPLNGDEAESSEMGKFLDAARAAAPDLEG